MEVVRHIDITGEERIRTILAEPDNFVFAAYECESMDGWVPDVGITNYANRSVFCPPSVARARYPATSWRPVPAQPRSARPRWRLPAGFL